MAEKEVIQRGTVPTVNSRGQRTSERPMTDSDRRPRASSLGGMSGKAEAALSGRGRQIDDAVDRAMGADGTYSEPGQYGSSTGQ